MDSAGGKFWHTYQIFEKLRKTCKKFWKEDGAGNGSKGIGFSEIKQFRSERLEVNYDQIWEYNLRAGSMEGDRWKNSVGPEMEENWVWPGCS